MLLLLLLLLDLLQLGDAEDGWMASQCPLCNRKGVLLLRMVHELRLWVLLLGTAAIRRHHCCSDYRTNIGGGGGGALVQRERGKRGGNRILRLRRNE
jgi:hypothetical protein